MRITEKITEGKIEKEWKQEERKNSDVGKEKRKQEVKKRQKGGKMNERGYTWRTESKILNEKKQKMESNEKNGRKIIREKAEAKGWGNVSKERQEEENERKATKRKRWKKFN